MSPKDNFRPSHYRYNAVFSTLNESVFLLLLQAKNRTGARGRLASGALLGRMN